MTIWVQDVRGGDGGGERPPWRIVDRESLSAGILGLGFAAFVMTIPFPCCSRWRSSSPFLVAAFLTLVGAWVVAHYVPETVQGEGRPRGKS